MSDLKSELSFSERYQKGALIGRGGMGEVYVAWDKVLNCEIALKLIRSDFCEDPRMRRRFNREARAFAFLRHEHIVEVYDFGQTEEEQLYLSMELIRGESLHGLRDVALPLSSMIQTVCQLLDALAHAHARGLVHRDLKAENVLLQYQEGALFTKLVDFGLAVLPSYADQGLAHGGALFGTPGYMAPEQAKPNVDSVGPATDIYAVGVILYELLSGHLPFEGNSSTETILAQMHAPVPPIDWRPHIQNIPQDIKTALTNIVEHALAKRTWERFVSALEFKRALLKLNIPKHNLPDCEPIQKLILKAQTVGSSFSHQNSADIGMKVRALESSNEANSTSGRKFASSPSHSGGTWTSSQRGLRFQTGQSHGSDALESMSDLSSLGRQPLYFDKSAMPAFHTTMYGREREEASLNLLAEQCLKAKGTVRLIHGKFGIGKSRLIRHFSANWQEQDLVLLSVSCLQLNHNNNREERAAQISTLELLKELFLQLIPVEGLDPENIFKTVRDFMQKYTISHESTAAFLSLLLDNTRKTLKRSSPELAQLSAGDIANEIDVLCELLIAASQERPLFILIDDIQRCDELAFDLLVKLKLYCERTKLLLLASYDPSEVNALNPESLRIAALPRFKQLFENAIELQPLSDEAMLLLLRDGFNIEADSAERIIDASFGNPLYALSLVQNLRKRQQLVMLNKSHFTLSGLNDDKLPVPDIISRHYQAKLEAIGVELETHYEFYREILLRLSVLGFNLDHYEVEAFWLLEEDQALLQHWRNALDAWQQYGILQALPEDEDTYEGLFDEPNANAKHSWAFSEFWLEDILQEGVPKRKLRNLHKRAAQALASLYKDTDYINWGRIAQHWDLARERREYCIACYKSIEGACRVGQYLYATERCNELYQLFEKKLLDRQNSGYQELWRALDWAEFLCNYTGCCIILGQFEMAEKLLEQLSFMSVRERTPRLGAIVRLLRAKLELQRADYQACKEHIEIAIQLLEGFDERIWASRAYMVLAELAYKAGQLSNAKAYNAKAADTVARYAMKLELVRTMALSAKIEADLGHIKIAQAQNARVHEIFHQDVFPREANIVLLHSHATSLKNSFALKLDQDFAELSQSFYNSGDRAYAIQATLYRVILALSAEQWQHAHELLSIILPQQEHCPAFELTALSLLVSSAETYLSGLSNEAKDLAERALQLYQHSPDQQGLIWAELLYAFILYSIGAKNNARELFARSQHRLANSEQILPKLALNVMRSLDQLLQHNFDDAINKAIEGMDLATQSEAPIFYTIFQIIGIEAAAFTRALGSLRAFCELHRSISLPQALNSLFLPRLKRAYQELSREQSLSYQSICERIQQLYQFLSTNSPGLHNSDLQPNLALLSQQSGRNTMIIGKVEDFFD